MYLQYIPTSSEETITNTLAGAKSVRGFFFIAKDEKWLKSISYQPKISISVDGRELCSDLMIMPFFSNAVKYADDNVCGGRSFDFRSVSINSCMNVSESVVRISALADDVVDVVFILDDTEVEKDEIEWVESICFNASDFSGKNFSLRYKPNSIFAYDKIGDGQIELYGDHSDATLVIRGNKEICPLPLHSIAPTYRHQWRDNQFYIQHESMSKDIDVRVVGGLSTSENPIYIFFQTRVE